MSDLSQERVVAPSGTYFAGALAQNAGLLQRIPLPEGIGAGRNARSLIRAIQVISADQLDWEFWFWANKLAQSAGHPDLEAFLGMWSFSTGSGDGKQIGGTGLYHYYIDGLAIPYLDEDGHNEPGAGSFLNVTLVNRSAGGKTNGAWFQAAFVLEPTLGS